jgi:tRNA threonylcarbamoyl adenosine modification protein (Sua5/YciO/YrdC/YwlC family)
MLLPIQAEHPEPRKIKRAVEALEAGEVIGYPTDTVYGLGCDLFNKKAIDRLYQIKEMDRSHQLAFICPDLGDIARYAIVENAQYRILKRLLPGPYCFILEATREVPRLVQSKRKTVGIRIPQHEVILEVVRALGRPVMSTTANAPGEDAFVDPREISDRFRGLSMVLDAGGGGTIPTTVVDLTSGAPVVVREGAGPIDVLLVARAVAGGHRRCSSSRARCRPWIDPRRSRCGFLRRRSRRESRRSWA